jgi:hypothetical protein
MWSRVLRALRLAAGMTLALWVTELQETPPELAETLAAGVGGAVQRDPVHSVSDLLRREGISTERQLRMLRRPIACSVDTVQRWESGRLVPDAAQQEAIIVTCLVYEVFATLPAHLFGDEAVTPHSLRRLLAEARLVLAMSGDRADEIQHQSV